MKVTLFFPRHFWCELVGLAITGCSGGGFVRLSKTKIAFLRTLCMFVMGRIRAANKGTLDSRLFRFPRILVACASPVLLSFSLVAPGMSTYFQSDRYRATDPSMPKGLKCHADDGGRWVYKKKGILFEL